jgi:uncharacterized protein YndB with AHSA1/START domain
MAALSVVLNDAHPERDLELTLETSLTPAQMWRGYTDTEMLKQWFCPRPWKTTEADFDLRPGGRMFTVMQGPNGERHEGDGCFLALIPDRLLVWTSALGPGFRPQSGEQCGPFAFTAIIEFLSGENGGGIYRARCVHADQAGAKAHADMGFTEGWTAAFRQLEELFR